MLQTTNHVIIDTPLNVLMGNIRSADTVAEYNLYSKALECLAFGHRYKDFFVVVSREGITEPSSDTMPRHIKVFDYGVEVAHMTIYTPEGNSRNKSQLQIRYNYDVQIKSPTNAKRSSDLRKIEQMVLSIKPAELSHCDAASVIKNLISESTSAQNACEEINQMARDLYYKEYSEQIRIFSSLCAGNDLELYKDTNMSWRDTFLQFRAKFDEGMKEGNKYLRHAVSVELSPMGKCRVTHRTEANEKVDMWMEMYESIENLPEEISGQMAVLDISLSSNDLTYGGRPRYIRVKGVGHVDGDLYNRYVMIGENFRDTRSQSQVEGS